MKRSHLIFCILLFLGLSACEKEEIRPQQEPISAEDPFSCIMEGG